MSADPLARLWGRLDTDPPVFFADPPDPGFDGVRARLVGLGLVEEIGPARVGACPGCGYTTGVVWAGGPGAARPYVPCPRCGPARLDPDRLRRWAVAVPRVLAGVMAAAGGRAGVAERVAGRVWFLGTAGWAGRARRAYAARAVRGVDRPAVAAVLAADPAAVLFLPTEDAVRWWGGTTGGPVVALETAVSLGPDGLTFDPGVVEGRLADAGLAGPLPGRKKPVPKRAVRAAHIAALTAELKQHLRAARDHAYAMLELRGEARLLPRPTQKELAKRTGLTETTVSRCLTDPSAGELKMYWDLAEDLDRIMHFGGRDG